MPKQTAIDIQMVCCKIPTFQHWLAWNLGEGCHPENITFSTVAIQTGSTIKFMLFFIEHGSTSKPFIRPNIPHLQFNYANSLESYFGDSAEREAPGAFCPGFFMPADQFPTGLSWCFSKLPMDLHYQGDIMGHIMDMISLFKKTC